MSFRSGGTFSGSDSIPLSSPQLRGNEWKYLKECLDSGWVSSAGPFVERFERAVADYTGASRAVALVTGTAALHTALRVVGVQPGDEVIVSDLTFIAPVNAIRYCQAQPVFMDVSPVTWHMDVKKLSAFLAEECEVRSQACYNRRSGRRIRAVLPVHILGLACEIREIVSLARQYCLRVVEDAAEAIGVRYQGQHLGTYGDLAALSFNGNKLITTGGGGMVITDSPELADYARYLTTQAKDDEIEYIHNEVGFNYRLTNLQTALGVAQLEQLEYFIARKHEIAAFYQKRLGDLDSITLMPVLSGSRPTYWLYTVLLGEHTTLEDRRQVVSNLNRNGIGARPLWHTIHDLRPYQDCQAYRIEHAARLYERAISLPSGAGLTEKQLEKCVKVFRQSINP